MMFRNGGCQVCLNYTPKKNRVHHIRVSCSAKKIDSYLPVRIFGKLLHPSAVVKNLGVWFAGVRNVCKTLRHLIHDEAAVLVANPVVSSRLDYCNFCKSIQCKHVQTSVYSHTWIVTNYNRYSQATPILKFLHPSYFSPNLPISCERYGTRYNRSDKRFLKFLNTTHLYTNKKTLQSQIYF